MGREKEKVANVIRTGTQTVGTSEAVLDLSFIGFDEQIVSLHLYADPANGNTVSLRGKSGDGNAIIPDSGIPMNVTLASNASLRPYIIGGAASQVVSIVATCERKDT
jgi:hypothetical protein